MYLECSECQVILEGEQPPFICPSCGLAGVIFSSIDEDEFNQHLAQGDEPYLLEMEIIPDETRNNHRFTRSFE